MDGPTYPLVTAERWALSVDAGETLDRVMAAYDTVKGEALRDALDLATGRNYAVACDPRRKLTRDMFNPRADLPDNIAECGGCYEHDVFKQLTQAGYVDSEIESLWSDTSSNSYASDGRKLDVIQVLKPFRVTTVRYWDYEMGWSYGYARQWAFDDESPTVRAGYYVIADIGDYSTSRHSVGYAGVSPPDWESVAYTEGFPANNAHAVCDTCGTDWYADDGSWSFEVNTPGDDVDAVPFTYGDVRDDVDDELADDLPANMTHCPNKECRGYVGYSIT